jgi:transcription-repair coupling factor (superfamily II helicase)
VTDAKAILEVHKRKKITLIASNEAQIKQSELFELQNIKVVYSPIILNVIGEEELILSLNKPEKKRRRRKTSILLDDLKTGDYVVHEDYGVGIFEAIEQMEILGGVKDFIVIRYIGDDKVLLPVENLDYIDRYIAGGGSLPVLDRLGKGSFAKLKESVKTKLFEIASSIVNTAAARALIKAPKIEVSKKVIEEFQSSAGFEYTDDQKQSIAEILSEISDGHIMDKLLSGDVGFGKTEVAMNAIYATCKAGFQSALIVPTTLLSSQHYKSLEKRFVDMGVRVAKLDRFISAKERKNIEIALKEGIIDVVVGTHSIFGVSFAKLGLVIVDEEHKFGVKQKEKIKELYNNIHMLSMSATPIPR